jgi:hypothetical protein
VIRVLAVVTILGVLAALAVPAAAIARGQERKVCVRTATLRDTPRGFAIARLYRNDRVTVVRRSATRGWVPVRTSSGLPGWILRRSLCRG